MFNTEKGMPSADDIDRAERLREIIENLKEINRTVPVIVEGKRDASALRKLGLEGRIITLHNGKNLYEFCDDIAAGFDKVVLLPDWDRTGENLYRSLSEDLAGHWEGFASFRDILKAICQKDINAVEGIPKLLMRLEGNDSPNITPFSIEDLSGNP
ncbi:MAG: toprim domain-containing protein [Nitrospirota bacterium]